ncbi:MAG: HAD-IA family hydrolase [Bacteroidales bacterium]|nr:HAD-IA family hydrolase [Bacteroidales bacterium]
MENLFDFFRNEKLKIGLASGSPIRIIELVLEKLGIWNNFEVIYSAEAEEFGKPHPAVFLSVAKQLGVVGRDCMVIEDSFYGLIAAKSARMKAIAYLPNGSYNDTRFDFADLKLRSFSDFNSTKYQYLQNIM